jgi:formamidopyrimidine-DNA glycosylase
MPELPEVETVVRGLAQTVVGDTIESVWLGSKPEPLKSPAAEIERTLRHARIVAVRRMGKHIVIELDKARAHAQSRLAYRKAKNHTAQFIVHLGMTGQLLVAQPGQQVEKHTHLIAQLASGRELRFVDPRRFGRLAVHRRAGFHAEGVEPLDVGFEIFVNLFRSRKTPIKSALLNQKLLRGVGNIYADESLFRAGVRPRRRAASLARAELRRLYDSIQQVLNQAIAAGGSSVSDYVNAEGEPGFFQFEHRVYGREGESCLVCAAPIKRVVIAGRSSHYCPRCQK